MEMTDLLVDFLFIGQSILIILSVLLSVAFFTLIERKVLSASQRRKGPNIVGFFGLLQPIADGLKLFIKESLFPIRANQVLFFLAPIYTFIISLLGWFLIPISDTFILWNAEYSLLYLFMFSSLGVYGIIMAGWSSNSKYAFLGGLRSTAQMISYELAIGLLFLILVVCTGSISLYEIIEHQRFLWFLAPLFPIFLIFCVSGLAETNRSPFDLPEAEAELVSGFNVEYSAMGFALFFIAEYANMLLFGALGVIFFLGGFLGIDFFAIDWLFSEFLFSFKLLFFLFSYVWVRATFPRYRYDQLMILGWKIFLPILLGWFFFVSGFFSIIDVIYAILNIINNINYYFRWFFFYTPYPFLIFIEICPDWILEGIFSGRVQVLYRCYDFSMLYDLIRWIIVYLLVNGYL